MFLEPLSNARGVSGDESAVRALIASQIQKQVDQYEIDALGSLLALKRAARRSRSSLTVLVAAHMDEVGFIVTHLDGDGWVHFEKVGSVDDRILPSKVVLIGEHPIPGVIGFKPQHLSPEADRKRVPGADELVIDIGASSRQDALNAVRPGDYATFDTRFMRVGENCVRGKAFDDRVGCALLVELLRESFPFDFYAAFTTQEELGLRGVRPTAYRADPDIALVLEATICEDSPKESDVSPITRLGAGPALTLMDRTLVADKRLVQLLRETAEEHSIPYQFKQPLVGSTDAGRLHLTRQGIPTAVVSVPARYIHSPAAIISLNDYQNALRLLRTALPELVKWKH